MTTEQTKTRAHGARTNPTRSPGRTATVGFLLFLVLAAIVAIAWNARNYPDARVGNPNVTGVPRPVRYLFGYDNWIIVLQVGTVIAVVLLVAVFVWGFRRYGPHPVLLMGLVTTIIVWQDPIMNWAPYAVYNPRIWHFPESWPLVSLSPTIEPFVVIGYVMFQLGPYFPAIWVLRKIQRRMPQDSFVWRHPLISLGALILLCGFIIDMILEVTLIHTGMYIYSQVIPFGSIFLGTPFQFPLLVESIGVTLVMIPAGVLIYRDDTGRTVAEKLAQKVRLFPNKPTLGMFIVMFVIVNVAYLIYGAGFTAIKWSGAATSVACPWPYPDAKVFDPQGYYEMNGQQGPFSAGIWSQWMSGQPDGRPHVDAPPAGEGRCAPGQR